MTINLQKPLECGHCMAGVHYNWHDAHMCLDGYCNGDDCGLPEHHDFDRTVDYAQEASDLIEAAREPLTDHKITFPEGMVTRLEAFDKSLTRLVAETNPSNEERIVREAITSFQANITITALQARVIASRWHGGQGSPLYALASSGAFESGLREEIYGNFEDDNNQEMMALAVYVNRWIIKHDRWTRPPVDGWAEDNQW